MGNEEEITHHFSLFLLFLVLVKSHSQPVSLSIMKLQYHLPFTGGTKMIFASHFRQEECSANAQ